MTKLKTKKAVLSDNADFKPLINAVLRQLGGMESINDINQHGINGGFSGFIYYSDTHKFAMRNRQQIIELLREMNDAIGEHSDIAGLVASFNCLKEIDDEEYTDLYKYLGGGRPDQGRITNALAWFAAEEVCRMFDQ